MNSLSDSPSPAQLRDPWRALRYALRAPLLLLHLLISLPLTVLLINPITARIGRGAGRLDHRMIRLWCTGLLRIFGFRVRQFGQPLPGGVLFVANHVAWLDITLMHSRHVVGFVAKAEISRWPLIGWLAARAGTIYHHRGNNESLNGVMHQMVERLRSQQAVGVFPEGRTTDGLSVHTFHARIFQAAVAAPSTVQPVALRYGEGGSAQALVAFQPGENFMANFLRVLGDPPRVAEVHFLQPIEPNEDGRRRLADNARAQIIAAMQR
jgi:1-acyl-sn-glycerol-3-phosphate acyltransferase